MGLFRAKVWTPLDIAGLKVFCILAGMIAGAHLEAFTRRNLWIIAIVAAAAGIKPALSYFFGRDGGRPA